MKKRTKALPIFISLLFSIPIAFAGPLKYLEGPFGIILNIFQNTTVVYGLTVIFFFMLLYGIYAGALHFVPVFKSDSGLSRPGKVVGIALSALTTLSIFYYTRPKGPQEVLATVLNPFGIFGGIALAALFAGIVYFGIRGDSTSKSIGWTAVAAGFGMIIAGMMVSQDSIISWGFFIMLIAMIFGLASSAFGKGRNDDGGRRDQPTTTPPRTTTPGRQPPEGYKEGEKRQPANGAVPRIDRVEVEEDNIRVSFVVD